jgi:lysozyme
MISENGLSLIKYFEGCKLNAYQDTAGIWTIGYGHTKHVQPGDVCTQDEANNYLIEDLKEAENRVFQFVKIDLQQCEIDSLISQAYNLRSFPKLAEHLNKDKQLYLEKLLLYCHDVQGHELLGLKKRRYAEYWLFEGMTWNDILPKLEKVI